MCAGRLFAVSRRLFRLRPDAVRRIFGGSATIPGLCHSYYVRVNSVYVGGEQAIQHGPSHAPSRTQKLRIRKPQSGGVCSALVGLVKGRVTIRPYTKCGLSLGCNQPDVISLVTVGWLPARISKIEPQPKTRFSSFSPSHALTQSFLNPGHVRGCMPRSPGKQVAGGLLTTDSGHQSG